ncbi:phage head-binding domain-containing protein [Escherichia fergusonii]|uniref:phage head-binding domain-containing protein n=1 Tax=Escherichia fergusonii TaxID=564 RepID=UPI000A510F18|nr:phage head-binding domain-containing protein [Escherichia fergusonii]
MTDSINANVVVSMPSQLFTMARSFKAVANGKIYIGKIDTDPVNPENRIQVYVENEDGSHVPVSQPIIINAAGYPVYNGQIAKFVTVQGHSMAVYDAYGAQQFYFPNVLKYDPDQFKPELQGANGASLIGTNHRGTLKADLDRIDNRTSGQSIADLKSNTGDIVIDSSVTDAITPISGSEISGASNGEHVTAKGTVGITINDSRVKVDNLLMRGDGTVDYTDTSPTYNAIIYGSDVVVSRSYAKDTTMGYDLAAGASNVKLIGNTSENMTSHPAVGTPPVSAGGYGVLLGTNEDVLILGHSAKGTNPADRHAVYLSNTNNTDQNKDVRVIGLRADYSAGPSAGDKPERSSPMIFARGNNGVIISSSQLRGGGAGINFTDERVGYSSITLSDLQLLDIRKNTADESWGIALNHASANASNVNTQNIINGVNIVMAPGSTSADRSNQYPIHLNSQRYVNIDNAIIASSGLAYGIRLIATSYCNISNVVGFTNDGTSAAAAVAFFQFQNGSSNIKLSNINVQSRNTMFAGLDNVTDLQVDWVRKVRINVVSGAATVSGDIWELVSGVTVTGASIAVQLKGHVTQTAADGAIVRPASANQFIVAGTDSKRITISVYNVNGTGVVPNTGTYSFDIVLYK